MFSSGAPRVKETVVDVARNAGYATGVITDSAGEIFSRIDLGFRM